MLWIETGLRSQRGGNNMNTLQSFALAFAVIVLSTVVFLETVL